MEIFDEIIDEYSYSNLPTNIFVSKVICKIVDQIFVDKVLFVAIDIDLITDEFASVSKLLGERRQSIVKLLLAIVMLSFSIVVLSVLAMMLS